MTKSKTTKRALLSSCVALMLCFSMLLGTTYAWFTDSVTSVNNIIKSGTLDVEMHWKDVDGEWKNVEETPDPIFNYQYWEPGYVEIKYIKLKNVGDLAFEYALTVIPNIENAEGNKLAEVLEVYCFPTEISRNDVDSTSQYYLGTLNNLMGRDIIPDRGVLLPEAGKGTDDYKIPDDAEAYPGEVTVCVALKMQEEAGNEYQNLTVGDGFAVQLLATQFTYENDSFDNTYDDTADNTPDDAMPLAKVTYATDLIGNSTATLPWNSSYSMVNANSGVVFDTAYVFEAPVEDASDSGYASWLADFAVSFDRDVTADDNIGIAGEYGSFGWIGFLANDDLFNGLGIEKLEANIPYDLLGSFGFNMDYEDLCVLVEKFTCSAWGKPAEDLTMTVELRLYETYSMEESVNHTPDGSASANVKTGKYVTIGKYSYTFEGGIYTADQLIEALEKGEDVVLASDIEMEAATTAPYGNKYAIAQNGGVLDGNGNTLTVDCYGDDYGIMTSGGTIKNLTVEGVARGVVLMNPTEDVILDNVILKNKLLYPMNTAEHATVEGVDLIVTDSTFGGWTSFAGIESASFTSSDFVNGNYGYGWPYDCLVKPYVNTNFVDCAFTEGYYLDLSALGEDCTVTLENCTVNGTAITADICGTKCDGTETFCVELPSGRALADCVIFK